MHLCINSVIQQSCVYDMNAIKILKLECPQWLYLHNANGKSRKTPIDLCIDARYAQCNYLKHSYFNTKTEKYLVEGIKERPELDMELWINFNTLLNWITMYWTQYLRSHAVVIHILQTDDQCKTEIESICNSPPPANEDPSRLNKTMY
eukprot:283118_1